MARIKSAFFTGFFCEFFQPFFFQPCTHLVEQLMAYCESVSLTRSSEPGCARNAYSTAHNSPIWLVPFVAPPASQSPSCRCSLPCVGFVLWSAHAQPIGPLGLPKALPSVDTVIVISHSNVRQFQRPLRDLGGRSLRLQTVHWTVCLTAQLMRCRLSIR